MCDLDGELHAAVVHVVVVAHAPLHHLDLLVSVVADGERLWVTRTLAEIFISSYHEFVHLFVFLPYPVCMKRW